MKTYKETLTEQQKKLADILSEIKKTKNLLKESMTGKCYRVTRGDVATWVRVDHAWECQDGEDLINIDGLIYKHSGKDGYMWLGLAVGVFSLQDLQEVPLEDFITLVRATTEEYLSNSGPDDIPIS